MFNFCGMHYSQIQSCIMKVKFFFIKNEIVSLPVILATLYLRHGNVLSCVHVINMTKLEHFKILQIFNIFNFFSSMDSQKRYHRRHLKYQIPHGHTLSVTCSYTVNYAYRSFVHKFVFTFCHVLDVWCAISIVFINRL